MLPTGPPLREAIEQVDAATAGYLSYYIIKCAPPISNAFLPKRNGPSACREATRRAIPPALILVA